jgi:hypothetical protein
MMLRPFEQKLLNNSFPQLQRWILIEAYAEIIKAGSDEPKNIAAAVICRPFTS